MVDAVPQLFIPNAVLKELLRRAGERGLSVEEYLIDMIAKDLDPSDAVRSYIDASSELLDQARRELEKGDLRQASEKIWGACVLAVKAHAIYKAGKRLVSHAELWVYKDEIAKELGDWVRAVFRQADPMHKNFYENLATRRDVEDTLKEVEKLVTAIREAILGSRPRSS